MKERKSFKETEAWKIIRTIIQIAFMALVILVIICAFRSAGISEKLYKDAYVMCADYANVRLFPNRKGEELGRFECGTHVLLDGKKRNGYLHIVDTGLECDGWIYAGYIVYDQPATMHQPAVVVSNGRLAARKYVNGQRTRWLKRNAQLTVYAWSRNWCVTNCGYVRTEYLKLEGD